MKYRDFVAGSDIPIALAGRGPCKKRWLLLPAQQLCFLFIFPPLEAGLPVCLV